MPLEDITIRQAKPRAKPYKLTDAKGLHILVTAGGSKLWRLQYRIAGKQKMLALGSYPHVGLGKARDERDTARKRIADGIDPSAERKGDKLRRRVEASNTFAAVAREFVDLKRTSWSPAHAAYVLGRLEHDAIPALGHRPIAQIEPVELLDMLRAISERGAIEMAHRVRSFCSQIFRYAIITTRCGHDPARDLIGALPQRIAEHMAAVPIEEMSELLARIDGCEAPPYCRNRITRLYLQLGMLTFVRPGELRKAVWSQFDLADAMWTIPAGMMKKRRDHLVPLSGQAIAKLHELRELTGHGALLFPGEGYKGLMSENTGTYALHALGYKGTQTCHGFRALASTTFNEAGFNSDWVERQLAHVRDDGSRRPYDRSKYKHQRIRMMQWWADYLDELRKGVFVRPERFKPRVEVAA